jgi:hypothetical protein
MFKLTGVLKKEEVREYKKKDGSQGKSKVLYIEPEGSIYPVRVNAADTDFKAGKVGEKITLDVAVFPYYFQDKQRKKALIDYYVPNKK